MQAPLFSATFQIIGVTNHMNYGNIIKCDAGNGIGFRTTLFVSGCRHHCKDCFNSATWDFNYGQPFTADTEKILYEDLKKPHITGLTVLGGEPLEPENQKHLVNLLEKIKRDFPDKDIWLYTGFVYEDIISNPASRANTTYLDRILACVDTLVDGPFVQNLKDLRLAFRGSSNQRLIDMNATRSANNGSPVIRTDLR